jgi:hypothetical protein
MFHKCLCSRFRRNSIPLGSSEGLSQELLVQEVFYPALPLEEWNVQFLSSLVQLHCVDSANGVHVWTIQLDALASQSEEFLHWVSVQKIVYLTLVLEAELR